LSSFLLCILCVILYARVLYMIGLPLYNMQQAWSQHNKHVVLPKKNCHITPLPPHNSNLCTTGFFFCPKVAIVKRFSCIYIFFSVEIIHLSVINITKDKHYLWPHLIQLLLHLCCRKKTEGEDTSNKSKEDAEQYPQSRRLLSPKKHFA